MKLRLLNPVPNCEETFGKTIERLRGALGGDDVEIRVVFNMTPFPRSFLARWPGALYGRLCLARYARICNAGAPWRLTLFADRYGRDELQLYFGDIEVREFKSGETFLDATLEISDEDVIFRYSDPPDST